ncbi:WG repeat-containing protein [Brevibacillus ginsengisoli]|uniref:WG repeat-containing protein n=1 Tax=Brevibacillus ginsengisoli TaxID=363854 RepID=UPI003CEC7126
MKKVIGLTVACSLLSAGYASAHTQPVMPLQEGKQIAAPMPPLQDFPVPKLYIIGQDNHYGYINSKGKVIVEMKYQQAGQFSEGLAFVAKEVNGHLKYGFINASGKEVIPLQYDYAADFHEGLALVKVDNQFGYINKQGKMEIKPAYHNANSFVEGMALVVTENDKGWLETSYINHAGKKMVSSSQFSALEDFDLGVAKVELYNPILNIPAYINRYGEIIWKQNLKDIRVLKQDNAPKMNQAFTLPLPSNDWTKKLQGLDAQAKALEQLSPNVKVILNQFAPSDYLQQLGLNEAQIKQQAGLVMARDVSILFYEKPIRGTGAVAATQQQTVGTWKARLFYLVDSKGNAKSFLFERNYHSTDPHDGDEEKAPTAEEKRRDEVTSKLYEFLYQKYVTEVKKALNLPASDNWTWEYNNGTLLLQQADGCGESAETYRFIPANLPVQ